MASTLTRIPVSPARGLFARLVFWILRRKLGSVPTSIQVVAGHADVFQGQILMERSQLKASSLSPALKDLVQLRAATLVGCPF